MKLAVVSAFLMVAVVTATTAEKVDYSGHMVIRTIPETEEQYHFLRNLQSTTSTDFWHFPRGLKDSADIRVSPDSYHQMARSLAENKMGYSILISDIGKLIEEEQRGGQRAGPFDYSDYHTYDEIVEYLRGLTSKYPIMTLTEVATAANGSKIYEVTVASGGPANKPVIFFDCNIHAREWITSTTCIWIIEHLASKYGSDTAVTSLVNQYDWKLVPVANPDGYQHTWSENRLWRKNRAINSGSPCIGVDINRNFRAGFGDLAGSSAIPCDETYHGTAFQSERETTALVNLLAANRGRIKAAFSIHSYGQQWMSPYGYQAVTLPAEYNEMQRVMSAGVTALSQDFGTRFTYGTVANTLYVASGITTDYYYQYEGIVHSYTLELRDTGVSGFVLPPSQIIPTATETWDGIAAAVRAIP